MISKIPLPLVVALVIIKVGVHRLGLNAPEVAARFTGILKGMEVHQLNRELAEIPTVTAELSFLNASGLLTRDA